MQFTVSRAAEKAAITYFRQQGSAAHFARDRSVPFDRMADFLAEVVAARIDEVGRWLPWWGELLRTPPRRILDAGCGGGFVTIALGKAFPQAEVVGVDFEAEAIELARLLADGIPRLSFHQADLRTADLGAFDLIVSRTVLEHVAQPREALGRLIRSLSSSGSLFLETPNYLFPYEPHVGLWMLPKSPKWLLGAECRITGRDPHFIDHLQFSCDRITLARWARHAANVRVIDLSARKLVMLLDGATPATPLRERVVRVARHAGPLRRLATRVAPAYPLWPSVQLLIQRT